MAELLPRLALIRSIQVYLSYVKDEGDEYHRHIEVTGQDIASPYSKFAVETAGNRGMVHIRSCYNNKYWVRQSEHSSFIVAAADKPEEDITKWSCTLFEPIRVEAVNIVVRFRHIQLDKFVQPSTAQGGRIFLNADQDRQISSTHFILTDWETLFIFPKQVAFKGHNGNYIGAISTTNPYLQSNVPDIGNQRVGHDITTDYLGRVCIKSNFNGNFWKRNFTNWVLADTSSFEGINAADGYFVPVKISNNVVALRNLFNNNFCKILTAEGNTDCLSASTPTISNEARLVVEELVLSRSIYNANFRLMDARIYSETILTMANGAAVNDTQEENTITIRLVYTETTSNTWNNFTSTTSGTTTTVQISIPRILDTGVAITDERTGGYEWGKTEEKTMELETEYGVIVPPMTMVRVSLLATRGTCDVPFSYTQRDTLPNGQHITSVKDDGVFTGVNCFNFHYHSHQTPII